MKLQGELFTALSSLRRTAERLGTQADSAQGRARLDALNAKVASVSEEIRVRAAELGPPMRGGEAMLANGMAFGLPSATPPKLPVAHFDLSTPGAAHHHVVTKLLDHDAAQNNAATKEATSGGEVTPRYKAGAPKFVPTTYIIS